MSSTTQNTIEIAGRTFDAKVDGYDDEYANVAVLLEGREFRIGGAFLGEGGRAYEPKKGECPDAAEFAALIGCEEWEVVDAAAQLASR